MSWGKIRPESLAIALESKKPIEHRSDTQIKLKKLRDNPSRPLNHMLSHPQINQFIYARMLKFSYMRIPTFKYKTIINNISIYTS
jgi:hypothetical protein